MRLATFSQWLAQATQPAHSSYYPLQLSLVSGLSYLGTACLRTFRFTSLPTTTGMNFVNSTYVISQLTAPLFAQMLENHQDITLVPLAGEAAHKIVSIVGGKMICHLAGQQIAFKEVLKLGGSCVVVLIISRVALNQIREEIYAD